MKEQYRETLQELDRLEKLDAFSRNDARLLIDEGLKLVEENERVKVCLSFFASVIKSGEQWTETCEAMYREALSQGGQS